MTEGNKSMARFPDVYASREWKQVRRYIISRAYGLCERCKRNGKVRAGKEVHHKIALTEENKTDWSIAFNPSNLELLCSDCHNDTHDRSIGLQAFTTPPGGDF